MPLESSNPKPLFGLRTSDAADAAILQLLQVLLQRARQQEAGLIAGRDPEFLHQYRVNLRKARSLLSLFHTALSSAHPSLLKTQLKSLISKTGELRDLDVLFVERDAYRRLLPAAQWPGLEALFVRIGTRRRQAQQQVATWLKSDMYQRDITSLETLLQPQVESSGGDEQPAIMPLVGQTLLKQYGKLCQRGLAIDNGTPAAQLHQLRIAGKKLRYLLELFGELFPAEELAEVVTLLKGLQDRLGRFNDCSVQTGLLLQLGQEEGSPQAQHESIATLVAALQQKQQHERGEIETWMADFSAAQVRENVQRLSGFC